MGKKVFVSLSHPFGAEIPRWPYFDKPIIDNTHTMAKRRRSDAEDHLHYAHRYALRCSPSRYGNRFRRQESPLHARIAY